MLQNCLFKFVLYRNFFFQLKYFNLSANNIGDDGFVAIASCISRIEMLEIGSTDDEKLSMKGIRALSKAVQLLDKPVIKELLNMSLFTEYSVYPSVYKPFQDTNYFLRSSKSSLSQNTLYRNH